MDDIEFELKRLRFEDFIWLTFIILSILNIFGDYLQREFLKTNNEVYDDTANKLYLFVLLMTVLVYLYFLWRNYRAYKRADEKDKKLLQLKLLGSSLLLAGIICLLYFQLKDTNFIGTPAI